MSSFIEKYDTYLELSKSNAEDLVELLIFLTKLGTHSSPEQIRKYAEKNEEVFLIWKGQIDFVDGLICLNGSVVNYFTTDFAASIKAGEKAILEFQKLNYPDLLGLSHAISGFSYRAIGKIDEAVDHLYKGADLINNGKLIIYKCYCYYQLGEINIGIEDYHTAHEHYLKALEIGEKKGILDPLFRIYNGLGNLYMLGDNYEEAFTYFQKSLDLPSTSEFQSSRTYCDLGEYYLRTGDFEKSIEHIKKSHEIRVRLGFLDAATTSLLNWAETLIMMDEVQKADELLNEVEANCKQFNAQSKLSKCYRLRGEVSKKLEDYEKSVHYYQSYVQLETEQKSKQIQRIYKLKNSKIEQQKKEIEEAHGEIKDSINYAKRIQEAIMPSEEDMLSGLNDAFVYYLPKDVVAGDFFWMEQMNGVTYFSAADCTGHGVPGAMVSVVCSNALNKALLEEKIVETDKLLDKTRELVISQFARSGEDVKDGMDISLCAWNKKTNELQWSGANNPLWIIRNGSGQIDEIKPDKQPIGAHSDPNPFTAHTIELNKGDVIYIFTDGFQDQFGGARGKKFKASQLKQLLLDNQSLSMNDQKQLLSTTFQKWKRELEQVDDVCVIGVRF